MVQPVVQAATLLRQSFARLPVERRTAILAIAAEEFAAHGYHGTSYNRLLARLGLGKSSAYHYFEGKADLFRAAVTDRYAAFYEGVAALPLPKKKRDFWPFVGAVNLRGFRFMLEDPTSAALMECLRREASSIDRILADDALLATIDQYHRDILIVGQRLGAVRTDATLERLSFLSRILASAADQMFVEEYRRDGAAKVKRRLQAIALEWTDAFRRLFEPKTPGRRLASARPVAPTQAR
jgi:AcrR family transcriptional regulator